MVVASILWRRLDTPGHDACRIERNDAGWTLDGAAVFRHDDMPARLSYRLVCDLDWCTQEGQVNGWLSDRLVDITVVRVANGSWSLNDVTVPGFEHLVDLDFGFTPATNLAQLRRAALAVGQAADIPVAWLDVWAGTLGVLPQRYERRSDALYWYEAPSFGYAAELEVTPVGFVRRYPQLWEAEV